jgi:hypothetical protein
MTDHPAHTNFPKVRGHVAHALVVAAVLITTVLVLPATALAQSDLTPPDTRITQAPPNPSGQKEATFAFTGTDDTTPLVDLEFQCRLDPQTAPPGTDPLDLWLDCLSPQFFTGLATGEHTFEVQALDAEENIDPTPATYTWTVLPPQTCADASGTAAVEADAWIDEHSPIDSKGDDSTLKVMSKAPGENSRAVVRFTLPQAPASCVVESATLRLYSDSAPDLPRTLQALRLTSAWGENNVNWGNQPATAGAAAEAPAAMGYVTWNVTAQVAAMYAGGGNHGFLIRHAIENDLAGAEEGFFSKEKLESPPELVLRFAGPGGGGGGAGATPVTPGATPPSTGTTPGSVTPAGAQPAASPSFAQLVAALRGDLQTAAKTLRRLGIAALLRQRGANVKGVHGLMPGTLRMDTVIRGKRVVLLRGSRTFGRAGTATLRLQLTKRGRQVLKRKRAAVFTLRGSFADRAAVIRAPGVKVKVQRRGR